MKKLLIGLFVLGSFSSFANGKIYCSKKGVLTSYNAVVELDKNNISTLSVSSSNNLATRYGQQSEAPYAFQGFKSYNQKTTNNGRTNQIILTEVTEPNSPVQYLKIKQSGSKFTLTIKGKGLHGLNRLVFKNCK